MALKQTTGNNAKAKMKLKAYEKELRKLQVELCHLQDWVKDAGACKTRCRRQGRYHQGDHRAREPSRLSHGGAAGTVGPGKMQLRPLGETTRWAWPFIRGPRLTWQSIAKKSQLQDLAATLLLNDHPPATLRICQS